jgi:hypothetical protein
VSPPAGSFLERAARSGANPGATPGRCYVKDGARRLMHPNCLRRRFLGPAARGAIVPRDARSY